VGVTQTRPGTREQGRALTTRTRRVPWEASMPRVLIPGLLLEVEEDGGNLVLVWLK